MQRKPLKLESSSFHVLGIVRFYAFRNGVTNVFDVPFAEADKRRRELAQEGWQITHHHQL